MMAMILVHKLSKSAVAVGDKVQFTFGNRNIPMVVTGWQEPLNRVYVKVEDSRDEDVYFYPGVFGLEFMEVDNG
jgi:hypothetical protein